MPNWKTYESSVRLLSAIIAAHPELKLNYNDVAKYYGGKTNYKSIWGRMTVLRGHGDALRAAYSRGIDPETVGLQDTMQGVAPKKIKEQSAISTAFGGDCTKSAIDNRFRKIKSHAVLIKKALADGRDPFSLPIDDKGNDASTTPMKEIASIMGSDATAAGIKFQVAIRLRPLGRAMLALKEAGVDPKEVDLEASPKKVDKQNEIAAFMGTDVTPNGLRFQYSDRIKPLAQKQAQMRRAGRDPKNIDLAVKEISKHFGSDSTGGGIGFQFRHIKDNAKRQRACVASGEDPLSLGIGTSEGAASKGDDGAGTKKGTPKGKRQAKPTTKRDLKSDGDEEEDHYQTIDGDDDVEVSPSKRVKAAMNKVHSGRITKPRKTKPAPGQFTELDSDNEDENDGDKVFLSSPIKSEKGVSNGYNSSSSFENHYNVNTSGNGAYAVQNGNPYATGNDDYYDHPNDYGEEA